MVVLNNITRQGNIISADYTPDGWQNPGWLAVDIKTGIVTDLDKSPDDGGGYYPRAAMALTRLSEKAELPKDYTYSWY